MGDVEISVKNITRVEGHGSVSVKIRDGRLVEALFGIDESPRFFEVMLGGKSFRDAASIASRICGICAVAHTTVSLSATEAAFGHVPSRPCTLYRRLIFAGEVMQSHILHAYFLVAPDLFNTTSAIALAKADAGTVARGLRLKKLANDLCAAVGGRHVHPVTMKPGGFTKLPDAAALLDIRRRLEEARTDVDLTVELFAGVRFPGFERETEYLSLKGDGEYPFISGDIVSSRGYVFSPDEYRDWITEEVVPPSTAKHANTKHGAYMVGALARFNNNREFLHPAAKEAAHRLGLPMGNNAPCHNPFMISAAQVVETVHCLEDSIDLIDEILNNGPGAGPSRDKDRVVPKAGRGVGVVEAPRGLLIHDYGFDENGCITDANCVIPTGQNIANIQMDMRGFVPKLADMPADEMEKRICMLIRAYDPCISCSTHHITVDIL